MSSKPAVPASTAQYRTSLLRRLKNMFPEFTPDIRTAPNGLSLQLFDASGRPRGRKVSLHVNLAPLRRAALLRLIGDIDAPQPEA